MLVFSLGGDSAPEPENSRQEIIRKHVYINMQAKLR